MSELADRLADAAGEAYRQAARSFMAGDMGEFFAWQATANRIREFRLDCDAALSPSEREG